jgi:CheY-like chemotaxis protein
MARLKVLIVEDEALEAFKLEGWLEGTDFEVVGIAETAQGAIKRALENPPNIVLMDIMLPDGYLAGAYAARQIQESTGAQILYITGIPADREVLNEVRRTKECQFLTKPITQVQLLTSLKVASMWAEKNKAVVFLSYSHHDRRFAKELLKHTGPLNDVGVDLWADTRIAAGFPWEPEIKRALEAARAAVCLVSIDFVNSAFIKEVELPALLKATEKKGLRVIPVFISAVEKSILERHGMLAYQGMNGPLNPIAKWPPARRDEECWVPLCEQLLELNK